jgi:hypothetical protein
MKTLIKIGTQKVITGGEVIRTLEIVKGHIIGGLAVHKDIENLPDDPEPKTYSVTHIASGLSLISKLKNFRKICKFLNSIDFNASSIDMDSGIFNDWTSVPEKTSTFLRYKVMQPLRDGEHE